VVRVAAALLLVAAVETNVAARPAERSGSSLVGAEEQRSFVATVDARVSNKLWPRSGRATRSWCRSSIG
jgi:hypothetical protein